MKTRVRQLSNGKYVAEVRVLFRWLAISKFSGVTLEKNSRNYVESCMVGYKNDALKIMNDYRAKRGL